MARPCSTRPGTEGRRFRSTDDGRVQVRRGSGFDPVRRWGAGQGCDQRGRAHRRGGHRQCADHPFGATATRRREPASKDRTARRGDAPPRGLRCTQSVSQCRGGALRQSKKRRRGHPAPARSSNRRKAPSRCLHLWNRRPARDRSVIAAATGRSIASLGLQRQSLPPSGRRLRFPARDLPAGPR